MKGISRFLIATVLLFLIAAPAAAVSDLDREQHKAGILSYLTALVEDLVAHLWLVPQKLGVIIDPSGRMSASGQGDTDELGMIIDPNG